MTRGPILHVIGYDVSDNRARGRLARRLDKRATRVQGSVFEAHLTRRAAQALARQLEGHLAPGDSLRIYPVVHRSVRNCIAIGAGAPPHAGDYWIV